MNRFKWILLVVTLCLMGATVAVLGWFKSHQRLGAPGLKCKAIPESVVVEINLPATVGEFDSTNVPESAFVTNLLPKDTSYAQRCYFATDGLCAYANVILMGEDRTSIHKPDYCLPGQGWQIVNRVVDQVPVQDGGLQYELPVSRWDLRITEEVEGKPTEHGGIYVFWFVTKDDQTPIHMDFMRTLGWHLLTTGELQRWAYVSYFSACPPGYEEEAYRRVKKLVASSVPEFQLPPKSAAAGAGP